MFSLMLASENMVFSIALVLMLMIAVLEGVAALFGAGMSSALESLLPESELNPHTEVGQIEADTALSRFLGWLRIGEVPILMLLVIFLLCFSLLGLAQLLLQALLAENIVVRAALSDLTAQTDAGVIALSAGAMLIQAGSQLQPDWFSKLDKIQRQFSIPLYAITTGLSANGIDLGSPKFAVMNLPKVLLIAGPGVNSTEAGEAWYNLERLAGISPTLAEPQRLKKLDLSRYTHIILPDGNYNSWQEAEISQLKNWAEQGGILWGHKDGAAWLAKAGLLKAAVWTNDEMKSLISSDNLRYQDKELLAGRQRIAGAIYQAELDLSHPLAFGFTKAGLPLFKNSIVLLQPSSTPFTNVALYSEQPQLAGYTAVEYVPRISQSAALLAHNLGKGRVIAMTDNPVFRGYFYGSSRLLVNALYLGASFSTAAD